MMSKAPLIQRIMEVAGIGFLDYKNLWGNLASLRKNVFKGSLFDPVFKVIKISELFCRVFPHKHLRDLIWSASDRSFMKYRVIRVMRDWFLKSSKSMDRVLNFSDRQELQVRMQRANVQLTIPVTKLGLITNPRARHEGVFGGFAFLHLPANALSIGAFSRRG